MSTRLYKSNRNHIEQIVSANFKAIYEESHPGIKYDVNMVHLDH